MCLRPEVNRQLEFQDQSRLNASAAVMRAALWISLLAIGLASLLGLGAASAGTLVEFLTSLDTRRRISAAIWRDLTPV